MKVCPGFIFFFVTDFARAQIIGGLNGTTDDEMMTMATTTTTTISSTLQHISHSGGDDSVVEHDLPIVNNYVQVLLLVVLVVVGVGLNVSVILNVSRDSLKLRMIHFILIRHVCITDCLGAALVLPVPLVAVAMGTWRSPGWACTLVSTVTATIWTMHLVSVALYRCDRVLAVWLPTGRYPVLSVPVLNSILVLTWSVAISGSYLATYVFGHVFQPALALCIPNVPLVFFIVVFSAYCLGLLGLSTGFVFFTILKHRNKRRAARMRGGGEQQLQQEGGSTSTGCCSSSTATVTVTTTTCVLPVPPTTTTTSLPKKVPRTTVLPAATAATSTPPSSSNNNKTVLPLLLLNNDAAAAAEDSGGGTTTTTTTTTTSSSTWSLEVKPSAAATTTLPATTRCERHHLRRRRRLLLSYAVTVGHLLLYLPAMFLVGLRGGRLPPGVALVCGLVVYSEFIVQPIALLLVSPKIRREVTSAIYKHVRIKR